jgi:hypothetical protein
MPTAFTPLLGLALPVQGELSGTWGDTVNTSITNLLDTAVAGTTTLSTDGNVTLTSSTGISDQARSAVILLSGARTAIRTVTAPARSKVYVVVNATTGGFATQFVGVGPTTGVTVESGATVILVWNGTDFARVSSDGSSASFINLAVSGTTTLSGLTASTALALDASKNVVSVTNTGTGNNVLANSPTFVTPALGTPSSGTVTNLTGTASININGTVGATTANTGAFTTLTTTNGIAPRVNSQTTIASPWAWDSTLYDQQEITALANALTINADAGTPANGQQTIFRFTDDGTARALTWTTGTSKSFRAVGVLLPTTTIANKTLYVGCVYNSTAARWDVLAVAQEA